MAVFMVEQGAGMAVGPPTLVTHMGLEDLTTAPMAAGFGHAAWVESLLLHQGEVQP